MDSVWVFNGEGGTFPAGIFSAREVAESWIALHLLSGTLTKYSLDEPLYDWALAKGFFKPKYPSQRSAQFIQQFNSAYLEHYHYKNGRNCDEGQEDKPEGEG